MRVHENKNCWVIEDYLDSSLVEEIKTTIQENLDNLYNDTEGYSTTGKNVKQYWLRTENLRIDDSRFYKFEEKYKNNILNRIKAADLFDNEVEKNITLSDGSVWSVIGEENSYHTIHFHGRRDYNVISTIVYLEVPETNIEGEPGNNIVLVLGAEPRNPYYCNYSPIVEINPEVGKLLIFPAWVLHGTYPQTKGIRQTFNADYGLSIKNESKSVNTTKINQKYF